MCVEKYLAAAKRRTSRAHCDGHSPPKVSKPQDFQHQAHQRRFHITSWLSRGSLISHLPPQTLLPKNHWFFSIDRTQSEHWQGTLQIDLTSFVRRCSSPASTVPQARSPHPDAPSLPTATCVQRANLGLQRKRPQSAATFRTCVAVYVLLRQDPGTDSLRGCCRGHCSPGHCRSSASVTSTRTTRYWRIVTMRTPATSAARPWRKRPSRASFLARPQRLARQPPLSCTRSG